MTTENPNFKVVDGGKQEQAWDETTSFSALLRDQNHTQAEEQEITDIRVRRPRAKEFFRVAEGDPGEACILWDGREAWLVRPDLALQVRGQIEFCLLYLAVTEDGEVFFLPLRDGRLHEDRAGEESRRRAVKLAQESWVRIEWGKKFRYRIFVPRNAELKVTPAWPTLGKSELLKLAMRDHWIDSPTHPLLLKSAETEVQSDDV